VIKIVTLIRPVHAAHRKFSNENLCLIIWISSNIGQIIDPISQISYIVGGTLLNACEFINDARVFEHKPGWRLKVYMLA
jgi:hypothetical protein